MHGSAGEPQPQDVEESWERPHGKRLGDGRFIVWGNAEDWKLVVTAVHERAYGYPRHISSLLCCYQRKASSTSPPCARW